MADPKTRLDWFLSRRIHVVTGKGGVGKSTLCAALGLIAARHGRRAVILETDTKERMSQLFEIPPVGYREVEVYPSLYAKNVDPDHSMEEYVLRFVRFQAVYDAIFKKSFLRHWVQSMPGFREFVVLGKIWDMGQAMDGRSPDYDLMIIDSPATGHGVSLWQLPESTRKAVGGTGPIAHYAAKMRDYFADPGNTAYHVATIPEELPYAETCELVAALRDKMHLPPGFLLVNQIPPAPFHPEARPLFEKLSGKTSEREHLDRQVGRPGITQALVRAGISQSARHAQAASYLDKLAALGLTTVRLPFVYAKSYAKTAVEGISLSLETELGRPL
ncbi:MAG: ArsA family ATPase [Bdellovibrionota bacterium]